MRDGRVFVMSLVLSLHVTRERPSSFAIRVRTMHGSSAQALGGAQVVLAAWVHEGRCGSGWAVVATFVTPRKARG